MNTKDFKNGLAALKKGVIPADFDDMCSHANKSLYELREFVQSLTECCYRLNNSNKILREIAERRTHE